MREGYVVVNKGHDGSRWVSYYIAESKEEAERYARPYALTVGKITWEEEDE